MGIQRLTAVCTAIRDSGPDTAEFDRAVHVLGYKGAQCEEAQYEEAQCEGAQCDGALCEGALCEWAQCEWALCEWAQ